MLTEQNKSLLRSWVSDLRSGDFDQVSGQLCEVNDQGEKIGFCCLGVLEERAIADGLIDAEFVIHAFDTGGYKKPGVDEFGDEDEVVTGICHDEVYDLIGGIRTVLATVTNRRNDDGSETTETREFPFETLNDSYHWTFGQIADAIEAQYLSGDK